MLDSVSLERMGPYTRELIAYVRDIVRDAEYNDASSFNMTIEWHKLDENGNPRPVVNYMYTIKESIDIVIEQEAPDET